MNITQSTNSDDASSQPFRDVLETFHKQIKSLTTSKAPAKEFLALCDQVRDIQLPKIGIYIEDRQSLPAMVRPLNRSLAAELEQRKAASNAKIAEAQAKRDAEELKKKQIEEKAEVSHFDLFRTPEFSEWDDQGIPTKDQEGKEVTKSQRKKLVKEWERQKKRHEEWLEMV
jgi:cysteinyl-tRNA synthetase